MRTVEILNADVTEELDRLPADMRARLEHIVRLIAEFGLERVREPHVRHLEGRLWEMRLTGRDGIARALYITAIGGESSFRELFGRRRKKPRDGKSNWRCGARRK